LALDGLRSTPRNQRVFIGKETSFFVDLTVRSGMDMTEALGLAGEIDEQRQAAGFDQNALDEAAKRGFGNGAFEDSEDDASAIVEELYPAEEGAVAPAQ